ncbi:unnamed protein product [Didymodactylos carnosus]|uniref:SWIM-type domain-containing protein n=1 Tax=Didymodactylos carnosus TaxID=1234261 RepID=A0A815J156_9BILA|nr:unnamed protein product [Didymodactylos carnosus]CAF4263037.1 unnamed protein product [Didymodactylos carnosus]
MPTILLANMIHETKQESTHLQFVRYLKDHIPDIEDKFFLVTDDELAFKNSFKKEYPLLSKKKAEEEANENESQQSQEEGDQNQEELNSGDNEIGMTEEELDSYIEFLEELDNILHDHLYCQTITHQPIEEETTNSTTTNVILIEESRKQTATRYCRDVRYLLSHKIKQAFERDLPILQGNWSTDFIKYFNRYILLDIDELGMWTIYEIDVKDLFKRTVTSNSVEGVNFVFKQPTSWKSVTIDRLILILNFLQGYFINELQRGYCGIGDYTLKPEYAKLQMDILMLEFLQSYDPHEIVNRIKNLDLAVKDDGQDERRQLPLASIDLSQIMFSDPKQIELTSSGAIMVKQKDNSIFTVQLMAHRMFQCSCGLSRTTRGVTECVHIIGAKRRLNIPIEKPVSKQNCAVLRKGMKANLGIKKTGQKKTTVLDKENKTLPASATTKNLTIQKKTTAKRKQTLLSLDD